MSNMLIWQPLEYLQSYATVFCHFSMISDDDDDLTMARDDESSQIWQPKEERQILFEIASHVSLTADSYILAT